MAIIRNHPRPRVDIWWTIIEGKRILWPRVLHREFESSNIIDNTQKTDNVTEKDTSNENYRCEKSITDKYAIFCKGLNLLVMMGQGFRVLNIVRYNNAWRTIPFASFL